MDRMKFFAAMLGVDIEGEAKKERSSPPPPPAAAAAIEGTPFSTQFKHPSEYAHLSEEQKQKLTEQMKGLHRQAMSKMPKQMGRG